MIELLSRVFGPWVGRVDKLTLRADLIAGILGALLVLPQTPPLHARPEQHGVVLLQLLPEGRQVGAALHVPLTHVEPLQHGLLALQVLPVEPQDGAFTHVPPLQLNPLQHGEPALHDCPGMRQLTP